MNTLRRRIAAAPDGRNFTPRRASGMRATMMRALKEPAAVRAQLLDGLLRGHRAARDDLPDAVECVMDGYRPRQGLQDTLRHEHDRRRERDRQQDVERAADQVDPEVPDRLRASAGETPD